MNIYVRRNFQKYKYINVCIKYSLYLKLIINYLYKFNNIKNNIG